MRNLPDIPTALTDREANALRRLTLGRDVYEAGALLGFSTVTIAQVARSVVSVDPHDNYPDETAPSTWLPYLVNLARYRVMGKVRSIRNTFQHSPPRDVHVAWADLTGKRTITEEFLLVSHDVPFVAIHDYGRSGCSGATKAIDYYIRRYRPATSLVDTTMILEKTWQLD